MKSFVVEVQGYNIRINLYVLAKVSCPLSSEVDFVVLLLLFLPLQEGGGGGGAT